MNELLTNIQNALLHSYLVILVEPVGVLQRLRWDHNVVEKPERHGHASLNGYLGTN